MPILNRPPDLPRPRREEGDTVRAVKWGFGLALGFMLFAILLVVALPVGCTMMLGYLGAFDYSTDTTTPTHRQQYEENPASVLDTSFSSPEPSVADIFSAKEPNVPPPPPPSVYVTFIGTGDGKAIVDLEADGTSRMVKIGPKDSLVGQWRMTRFVGDNIVEIHNPDTRETVMLPNGVKVGLR